MQIDHRSVNLGMKLLLTSVFAGLPTAALLIRPEGVLFGLVGLAVTMYFIAHSIVTEIDNMLYEQEYELRAADDHDQPEERAA